MASKKKAPKKSALSMRIASQTQKLERQLRLSRRDHLQALEKMDAWHRQYKELEAKRNAQGELLSMLANALDTLWEPLELRIGSRAFPCGTYEAELVHVDVGVSINQLERCELAQQTRLRPLAPFVYTATLAIVANGRLVATVSPAMLERVRKLLEVPFAALETPDRIFREHAECKRCGKCVYLSAQPGDRCECSDETKGAPL